MFMKARRRAVFQALVYLRTYAVDQNQAYAQAVQQCKIMNVIGEIIVKNRLAAERNHKGLVAMGMYIRLGVSKPADE